MPAHHARRPGPAAAPAAAPPRSARATPPSIRRHAGRARSAPGDPPRQRLVAAHVAHHQAPAPPSALAPPMGPIHSPGPRPAPARPSRRRRRSRPSSAAPGSRRPGPRPRQAGQVRPAAPPPAPSAGRARTARPAPRRSPAKGRDQLGQPHSLRRGHAPFLPRAHGWGIRPMSLPGRRLSAGAEELTMQAKSMTKRKSPARPGWSWGDHPARPWRCPRGCGCSPPATAPAYRGTCSRSTTAASCSASRTSRWPARCWLVVNAVDPRWPSPRSGASSTRPACRRAIVVSPGCGHHLHIAPGTTCSPGAAPGGPVRSPSPRTGRADEAARFQPWT